MNFIEVLKSVGGVKPCLKTTFGNKECPDCRGTGQVLDLAPLLAKSEELPMCALELLKKMPDNTKFGTAYVVGPQRASNLVYEIARQLGGTAVVAEKFYAIGESEYVPHSPGVSFTPIKERVIQGEDYRLSLPVPESAMVLFVTDRYERDVGCKEIHDLQNLVLEDRQVKILPYVLCLVDEEVDEVTGIDWKVISLHKEKTC